MEKNKQFEMYKPLLEWAEENKDEYIQSFINICIRINDVMGMWGYLLEFFDSVNILIDNFYLDMYLFWEVDAPPMTRIKAQQGAIKKAFEILNSK